MAGAVAPLWLQMSQRPPGSSQRLSRVTQALDADSSEGKLFPLTGWPCSAGSVCGLRGRAQSQEDPLGLRGSLIRGEPIPGSAGASANPVDASPSHTRLSVLHEPVHTRQLPGAQNNRGTGRELGEPPRQGRVCSRALGNGRNCTPAALAGPRTQLQPRTTSTEPLPGSAGRVLSPPWAQAHAQPWQVSSVPGDNSSPGTKPGKSDAKPGWGWDSVCIGCRRALQTIPLLPQGGLAAPEAQGHCLGPGMFPSAPGLVSEQPQPHQDWGRGTEPAFICGMSPTRSPGMKETIGFLLARR